MCITIYLFYSRAISLAVGFYLFFELIISELLSLPLPLFLLFMERSYTFNNNNNNKFAAIFPPKTLPHTVSCSLFYFYLEQNSELEIYRSLNVWNSETNPDLREHRRIHIVQQWVHRFKYLLNSNNTESGNFVNILTVSNFVRDLCPSLTIAKFPIFPQEYRCNMQAAEDCARISLPFNRFIKL